MDAASNFEGTDLSLSVGKAYGFVIFAVVPLVAILALIYMGLRGTANYFAGLGQLTSLPSILPVMVFGIPLHEFLHAVGWSIFGRIPIREVKFGVMWKALTPYAHLRNPIRAFAYKAGAISPMLVMGFFPYIMGLLIGHAWLMNFGLLYILAAGGDLIVVWTLRNVRSDVMVIDHPTRVGCIVLDEEHRVGKG
jgi:hypothetical protein